MNKIKLCIFDMDGLLLDSERFVWSKIEKESARECGKEMTDEFIIDLMGINTQTYMTLIQEKFGKDFPINEYMNKIRHAYANIYRTTTIPLRPGVIELLEFLKNNDILISLGTSTEKNLGIIALEKSGILKYFDYCVFGDQVKNGKPDPEIYLKSVNHFNLNPEDCIVFEDTPTGAKSAYNGNIRLIMVPDIKEPTDYDKKMAYAIIDSLHKAIPIIKKENNIK